jgi:hypothetical protein
VPIYLFLVFAFIHKSESPYIFLRERDIGGFVIFAFTINVAAFGDLRNKN